MMNLRVEILTGSKVGQYKNELARLRIQVFREFPYLYDGTLENEEQYLETLMESPKCILVVVFDRDKVVGASTGMPLVYESMEIKQPWLDEGVDISKVFYFSESVLLKDYRGQGLGVKFFNEREKWARQLGYDTTTFCGVIREKEDPNKPLNYETLDRFWKNRGYHKKEGFICTLSWKQLGDSKKSSQKLQFWYKDLKDLTKKN